jgi:hypothetical protein
MRSPGITLLAAGALLLVALGLARVARGSAVAENITFVVAACACLGAQGASDEGPDSIQDSNGGADA